MINNHKSQTAHSHEQPNPTPAENPASILAAVRSVPGVESGSSLRIIDDEEQRSDHSGKPIEPVTAAGMPFRYKVRLRRSNAYASTADEILSLFIDGYDPAPRSHAGQNPKEAELDQVRRRGRHCIGVMVSHIADAMLTDQVTAVEEQLLKRSADLGGGKDPLTRQECPVWSNPDVPMLLMGDLYATAYDKFDPPAGNVIFLHPGHADRYLQDLASLGLIALSENPAYTGGAPVEIRAT